MAVAGEDDARRLARDTSGSELMGERDCIPCPDSCFGNSPSLIENEDLAGRTLVFTTSAGTQGLAAAAGAEERITGAFVNAGAVVGLHPGPRSADRDPGGPGRVRPDAESRRHHVRHLSEERAGGLFPTASKPWPAT
jgi:hypothetical protein